MHHTGEGAVAGAGKQGWPSETREYLGHTTVVLRYVLAMVAAALAQYICTQPAVLSKVLPWWTGSPGALVEAPPCLQDSFARYATNTWFIHTAVPPCV